MNKLEEYQKKAQQAFNKVSEKREAENRLPSSSVSEPKQQTGMERLVQGVSDFFGIKQPEPPKQKSVLQRLMEVPVQQKSWYSGEVPTVSEAYAQIYKIGQKDQAAASQLFTQLQAFQQDPTTPFYNPYTQATNRKIADIASYGVDVSKGINDDFFKNNAWLMNYYSYGSTNNPLGTAKKRSNEQNAAAIYYDLLQDEDRTKKAENEWAALQEEVKYWAGRTDRNLSDAEILNRIDWSKYKTLQEMDESAANGAPIALNRAVGYSKDNLYGVLWEARNGVSGGNAMMDAVRYRLGQGEGYKRNDETARRLDANSDYYNPYWTGNTIDDAALYFGVQEFDQDWIEANKWMRGSNDATEQKMYRQVVAAEEFTRKAEDELKMLREQMDRMIGNGSYDAKQILTSLGLEDEDNDYSALGKIDKSLANGSLVDTTRAIKYSYEDIKREIEERCAKNAADDDGLDPVQAAKNKNIRDSAVMVSDIGTPEEQTVFQTAISGTYEQDVARISEGLANGTVDPQTATNAAWDSAVAATGDNYLNARNTLNNYQSHIDALAELEAKIAELLGTAQEDKKPKADTSRIVGTSAGSPQERSLKAPSGEQSTKLTIDERTAKEQWVADQLKANGDNDMNRQILPSVWDALPQAEKDKYIEAARQERTKYDGYDEATRNELMRLEAQADRERAAISKMEADKAAADQQVKATYDAWQEYVDICAAAGQEPMDYGAYINDMDLLSEAANNPVPLEYHTMNVFDAMVTEGGASRADAAQTAQAAKTQLEADLKALTDAIDNIGEHVNLSNAQKRNLRWEQEQLQNEIKGCDYYLLQENADFAKTSAKMAQEINEAWNKGWIARMGAGFSNLDYAVLNPDYATAPDGSTQYMTFAMSDAEKQTYLYIRATEGEKAAKAYYDYLTDDTYGVITNRYGEASRKLAEEVTQSSGTAAVLMNIAKVISSPAKGVGSVANVVKLLSGGRVNRYSKWSMQSTVTNQIAQTSKEGIAHTFEKYPTLAKMADFAYDTVSSAAESYMNALAFGGMFSFGADQAATAIGKLGLSAGESLLGAVPMAAGAMNDTLFDVLERGGSVEQALMMAGVSFASELVSEAVSLDNITGAFFSGKASGKGIKDALKQEIRSFVMEGSEEVFSGAIERLGDDWIMDELSERTAKVNDLMGQMNPDTGRAYTEEEARRIVSHEFFLDIMKQGLSGGFSGALSTGAGYVTGRATRALDNRAFNKQFRSGDKVVNRYVKEADGKVKAAESSLNKTNEAASQARERANDESLAPNVREEAAQEADRLDAEAAALQEELNTARQENEKAVKDSEKWNAMREGALQFHNDYRAAQQAEAMAQEAAGTEQEAQLREEADKARQVSEASRLHYQEKYNALADAAFAESLGITAENMEQAALEEDTAEETEENVQQEAEEPEASEKPHVNRFGIEVNDAEARRMSSDVTALNLAQKTANSSQSDKTATVAAVLTNGDTMGSTASQHMMQEFGTDKVINGVKKILSNAVWRAGVGLQDVKGAIVTAAMNAQGEAHGILDQLLNGSVTSDKIRSLVQAAQNEAQDPAVRDAMRMQDKENRSGQRTKQLLGAEEQTQLKSAEAAVDTARGNLKVTQQQYEAKQGELADATRKVIDLTPMSVADPQNAELRSLKKQALDKRASAEKELQNMQGNIDGAKQNLQEAKDNYKDTENRVMNAAREQANAEIEAEDAAAAQAIAEQQAAAEEQARQQAEQAAQLQAEEDQRTGKAEEDSDAAKIDAYIRDNTSAKGEDAKELRDRLIERRNAKAERRADMSKAVTDEEAQKVIGSFARKTGLRFEFADDLGPARGRYDNGVVTLNKNLTVGQAVVEAALHEITHSLENTKSYEQYSKIVREILFKGNQANEDAAIDQKIADYAKAGKDLTPEAARREIVADFARTSELHNKDTVERMMAAGLGAKIRNTLHNIRQYLRNLRLDGEERTIAENLRKAERAFTKAIEEEAKNAVHPEGGQFSVAQFAQAAGLQFDEDTRDLYEVDGTGKRRIITEVTTDMIEKTPVGMLIDAGLQGEQNQKAKEMMAGLMSMIAKYKDSDLVWEIGASTLSSTFSALKSNSDPQYKTTVDFGTVCAKTQAIIDVMSQVMLDRVKAGRTGGLTRQEIMTVYDKVHDAKLSVPCPVCYVFSRWMGVPSLLGQMSQYQHDYVVTNEDGSIDREKTQAKADAYIRNAEEKYGSAKAINAKKANLQGKLAKLEEQRVELEGKLYDKTLTQEQKDGIRSQIKDMLGQMVDLDNQIGEVSAYNWITQALCKKTGEGKYVVDEKFRVTPDEILFDLNRTGEFAGYEKNWKYRNTRGAGMGKAIMPYSGETIGDILYGVKQNGRQTGAKNPWLKMDPKSAQKQLKNAIERAKKQNLVGGQRLQSTSDFRPEWGLDYIMSFLELQAAQSKVQMYTKVAEAVDFLASVGADVNLSIMGKGQGWHVASEEEIAGMSEKQRNEATVDGKVYVMDFSDITGMKYGRATELKNKYDNVQMILVGMNDTHIRLALANSDIDFVIPWHSSGNSKDILAGLIAAVGEKLNSSVDYTTTQADMVKGTKKSYTDENGNKVEYTVPGEQTAEQKALWDARVKLLMKGGNALDLQERQLLLNNPITAELYRRFTQKGYDPDCYNVKLSKEQANQIFPYEYWVTDPTQKGGTKDTADENGKRFVEYCESMGIVPRFSQFKDVSGYWKLLIDRAMYDNNGNYRSQQVVDVTNAKIGALDDEGRLTGSDLPSQAEAKYAPKDPRSPNYQEYTERERRAVENAEAALDMQYTADDQVDLFGGDMAEEDEGQMSIGGDITDADLDQMLSNAGVLPSTNTEPESMPAVRSELPTQTPSPMDQKQRQFGSQTAQRSDALHDEVKDYLFNNSGYMPDTNREQIDRSIDWVQSKATDGDPYGYQAALEEVMSDGFNYSSADGQARMLTVMSMAALQNRVSDEVAIADAYNKQGTQLGRALQARNIFAMMTPLGRKAALRHQVDDINRHLAERGRETTVILPDDLFTEAGNAKTPEEFDRVQDKARKALAEQIPPTFGDQLRAWRMLSMLGNPRTHIRNLVGNAIFMPVVSIKNKIGAALEIAYAGIDPNAGRTKSFVTSSENRAFARKDAENMQSVLTGEQKRNETSKLEMERRMFGTGDNVLSKTVGKALQKLSDLNSKALEKEDWIFLKRHYINALSGWMQANHVTPEQMKGQKLDQAREYAINEAQKATYRDYNDFAAWLNKASRSGGFKGFLVDAILPFKKTPANILKRGIEYSPVGLIRTAMTARRSMAKYEAYTSGRVDTIPKGAMSPTQVIDSFASGLTGSAICAIGYALAKLGIVTCGLDKDEDEFEKLRGRQEYSLNIGLFGHDVSMTIDWAAPVCMPFFVGAAIHDAYDDGNMSLETMADALLGISEPMFNLSMLDSVNSLLRTSSYSDANQITQIAEKIVTNYVTSFVPSLLGAASRTYDPISRKAYVPAGEANSQFKYAAEQVQNKTPWSVRNIPYRNAFGDIDKDSQWKRAFENFISPGYINKIETNDVYDELERLYQDTGDSSVIPSLPSKYFGSGENRVNLTDKQYDQLTVDIGQMEYDLLEQLFSTDYWEMSSPADRADMVGDIRTYSKVMGQAKISDSVSVPSWVSEASKKGVIATITKRREDALKTAYIDGHRDAMVKAAADGDYEAMITSIEALRAEGKETSGIKSSMTTRMKPRYQEAAENNDTETMLRIESMLLDSGLGYKEKDFKSWLGSI